MNKTKCMIKCLKECKYFKEFRSTFCNSNACTFIEHKSRIIPVAKVSTTPPLWRPLRKIEKNNKKQIKTNK